MGRLWLLVAAGACGMQPAQTPLPHHTKHITHESGRVAAAAEERKEEKYCSLPPTHWFAPLSIETMGVVGPKSLGPGAPHQ